VHTGTAFVGIVGSGNTSDFTALGDPVNIAAHLASQAAIGEVLVTDRAAEAAGVAGDGLERRHLSLKGHPWTPWCWRRLQRLRAAGRPTSEGNVTQA